MKKENKLIKKSASALAVGLKLVLGINANTTSCYILNEPKEPKGIEKFKLFK